MDKNPQTELWEAANHLIEILYKWERLWPMDDTPVKKLPKWQRKAYRKARLEMMQAHSDLHIIVAQIRYHGWELSRNPFIPSTRKEDNAG